MEMGTANSTLFSQHELKEVVIASGGASVQKKTACQYPINPFSLPWICYRFKCANRSMYLQLCLIERLAIIGRFISCN